MWHFRLDIGEHVFFVDTNDIGEHVFFVDTNDSDVRIGGAAAGPDVTNRVCVFFLYILLIPR